MYCDHRVLADLRGCPSVPNQVRNNGTEETPWVQGGVEVDPTEGQVLEGTGGRDPGSIVTQVFGSSETQEPSAKAREVILQRIANLAFAAGPENLLVLAQAWLIVNPEEEEEPEPQPIHTTGNEQYLSFPAYDVDEGAKRVRGFGR